MEAGTSDSRWWAATMGAEAAPPAEGPADLAQLADRHARVLRLIHAFRVAHNAPADALLPGPAPDSAPSVRRIHGLAARVVPLLTLLLLVLHHVVVVVT